MQEIIRTTINQTKRFPANLLDVIVHPRKFARKIPIADRNLSAGTAFLVIACLASAAALNIFSFQNLALVATQAAATFLLLFSTTVICGAVMVLSWRGTRTSVSSRKIFQLYLYHSGAWNVLFSVSIVPLVAILCRARGITPNQAIMSMLDPLEAARFAIEEPNLYMFILGWSTVVCVSICLFWGIPAWLAYKDLHRASLLRTVASLLAFCIGCLLVIVIFSFSWGQIYSAEQIESATDYLNADNRVAEGFFPQLPQHPAGGSARGAASGWERGTVG